MPSIPLTAGFYPLSAYGDYDALSERLENALAELEDIGETAESLAEELDIDEREAERVENRLDEIRSLKKKYGGSVEEALSFLARAREELSLLENSAEECEKLRVRLGKQFRAALCGLPESHRTAEGGGGGLYGARCR